MDKPVIIFGAKGLAIVAQEIFESNGVVVFGFLDEDASTHGSEINGISVLGRPDNHGFLKLIGQKCEAFVAFEDPKLREYQVDYLKDSRHVMPVNAIHQQAIIAKSAGIGHGNLVNADVKIGAKVQLGSQCIINTGAIIEHEVVIGDLVQVGAGAVVGTGVKIKDGAFIGAGAVIIAGVTIGEGARVGAGAVVIGDVSKKETVFGNPAQKVKA